MREVILFLKTPWPAPVPDEPVRLELTRVEVRPSRRLDLDKEVRQALGDLFFEEWQQANVFAIASSEDDGSGGAPAAERIDNFYFASWLHGVLNIDFNAIAMTVETTPTGTRVAGFELLYRPRYLPSAWIEPDLGAETLRSVDKVAVGIAARYRRKDEFHRLWHGYRALLRAFEASLDADPLERGANLVRALEALVFPANVKGLGADQFGRRTACFFSSGDVTAMTDCYTKVRNAALHMHNRSDYLSQPKALARVDELCLLLERLAPFVWRQVLGKPDVLESMRDARLAEFQVRLAKGELGAWLGDRFELESSADI